MLHILLIYKYWVLVPLGIIEGPIVAFACGAAASLGYIQPFIAYGILLACGVFPDMMWYTIGKYGSGLTFSKNPSSQFGVIRDNLSSLHPLWDEHPFLAMLSSKLAYGISAPFLVSAGLAKMPFGKFMRYSVSITAMYLGFLLATGYFFAAYYLALKDILKNAEIFIGVVAALFLIAFFFVGRGLHHSIHTLFTRRQS